MKPTSLSLYPPVKSSCQRREIVLWVADTAASCTGGSGRPVTESATWCRTSPSPLLAMHV